MERVIKSASNAFHTFAPVNFIHRGCYYYLEVVHLEAACQVWSIQMGSSQCLLYYN